tara:strand:- start:2011 stop:3780 length:1770 start_codon:yes stop_codon:yes gene_type:complete
MAKQSISIGSSANDGTGSNLRTGGSIINNNFNEVYNQLGDGTNLKGWIRFLDTASTSYQTNLGSDFKFIGGTGIDAVISGTQLTISTDATVPTNTSVATFQNKSLDLANNTITGTTSQFNTALSDGNFATIAGTETLTGKSIDLTDNTITGTTAEFNTALSDGDFATLDGTETLTNKTITVASNSLSGPVFNVADTTSTTSAINFGDVLKIQGGAGITTTVSGDEVTVAASGITNAQLSGSAGITNANLADDSVTVGYTAIALGSSATTVNGLSITGNATFQATGNASAIKFNHANFASFPNASTYPGSPAIDEATTKLYMASGSGWIELLSENSGIENISNVSTTSIANGQGLVWNSSTTKFEPGSVGGSGAFTAGTALDQANERISDVKYIGLRSSADSAIQEITVTAATKTSAHYNYGTGSSTGYLIEGDESPLLQLTPGVWKFNQSDGSNTGHPLKFYRDSMKNVEYDTNVTIAGTPGSSGAYTQITIDSDTPSLLYYQCTAHSLMGHAVEVIGGRRNVTTDKSNTGDGSTSTITINSGRTVDDVLVFVNGICLVPTDDYTISGTTLTFVLAPSANAEIVVRYLS